MEITGLKGILTANYLKKRRFDEKNEHFVSSILKKMNILRKNSTFYLVVTARSIALKWGPNQEQSDILRAVIGGIIPTVTGNRTSSSSFIKQQLYLKKSERSERSSCCSIY